LRSAGKVTTEQRQALVSGMAAFVADARVVVPTRSVALCRDPGDNMVLECCQAARASVLITGDRDILDLAERAPRTAGLGRLAAHSLPPWLPRTGAATRCEEAPTYDPLRHLQAADHGVRR